MSRIASQQIEDSIQATRLPGPAKRDPRRPRQPKPIAVNTLQLALRNATRLTPDERSRAMGPLLAAWQDLRCGSGTLHDWQTVDSHNSISLQIEAQGVVRGLSCHLQAAADALQAIHARAWRHYAKPMPDMAGTWTPTPLRWHEMQAIDLGIELFEFQLKHLSARELARAVQAAIKAVTAAGGRVVTAAQHYGEVVA